MTDTPVRDEIAAADEARKKTQAKKVHAPAKKSLFTKPQSRIKRKTLPSESTSSSESDNEMQIVYDDSDDSEENDQSIIEGDFVIVKVHGKSRSNHYIARVDAFDGGEFEGVFLRRVLSLNDRATFVVNAEDEALWLREDIAKKLPTPAIIGTSRRTQFQFRCNLDEWNL